MLPILKRDSGSVREVRRVQNSNALGTMLVAVAGSVREVKGMRRNKFGTFVTPWGTIRSLVESFSSVDSEIVLASQTVAIIRLRFYSQCSLFFIQQPVKACNDTILQYEHCCTTSNTLYCIVWHLTLWIPIAWLQNTYRHIRD